MKYSTLKNIAIGAAGIWLLMSLICFALPESGAIAEAKTFAGFVVQLDVVLMWFVLDKKRTDGEIKVA